MVVAVAIAIILIVGSVWLFAAHPGALRAAVDGFDANYADARALAAKTGNGATIVFAPRKDASGNAIPGFTMRVYSGRPNGVSAVTQTNAAAVISDASISETTFGSPPFALFLSSAGKPSGKASYPAFNAQGAPQFAVIAQQPPCPNVAGITLTFRANNGATETRNLGCDGAMPSGTAAPQPTLTPEALRVDTPLMIAHWTSDTGPLHFKVGEFGYRYWFASSTGAGCDTSSSDLGEAAANFATPYPYELGTSADMSAAPAPPNAPYTWAVQTAGHPPDQPPGSFALVPFAGNGGVCTVRIVDSYNQEVDTHIQVMGDLSPRVRSLSMKVGDPAVALAFGKTFDTDVLALQFGGPCGGIVSATQTAHAQASSVSTQATTATATIAALAAGSCDLQIGDQYGEPVAIVHVNVKANQPFATWPAYLEVATPGAVLGTTTGVLADANGRSFVAKVGPVLNALLGGATAQAAGYTGWCYAHAFAADGVTPDTSLMTGAHALTQAQLNALNVSVTTDGCILDAAGDAPYQDAGGNHGAMVMWEPGASASNFAYQNSGCANYIEANWSPVNPAQHVVADLLPGEGRVAGSCNVSFSDSTSTQTPAPDAGLVAVNVIATCASGATLAMGATCIMQPRLASGDPDCNWPASNNDGWDDVWHGEVTTGNATLQGGATTPTSSGSPEPQNTSVVFVTRTGPGTISIDIYQERVILKNAAQCMPYRYSFVDISGPLYYPPPFTLN